MKNHQLILLGALSCVGFLACGKPEADSRIALPREWIVAEAEESGVLNSPAAGAQPSESSDWRSPSPEADEQIRSVFTLQGEGLERMTQAQKVSAFAIRPYHGGGGGMPGEAPWHLNNFIAEFGVTVQGIFGSLVSDGGFAVKGIWRRQGMKRPRSPKMSPYSVQWDTGESRKRQLEPVIQSVLQAGLVQKEGVFRRNLDQAASRFERMAKLLEAAQPEGSGWEVSRFALILSVDASGSVTPVVSVGGGLLVRLDWDRPRPGLIRRSPVFAAQLNKQDLGFLRIVRALGAQMGAAQPELNELEGLGAQLENFHVGIGISASGNVGLVSLGGELEGMLFFSRPGEIETIKLRSLTSDSLALGMEIPVLRPKVSGLRSAARKNGDEFLVKPDAFRKGLKRAIRMGGYFARMGLASQTSSWKLDEVETEFEIALSGDFGVVTVESMAHLALEFHFEGGE